MVVVRYNSLNGKAALQIISIYLPFTSPDFDKHLPSHSQTVRNRQWWDYFHRGDYTGRSSGNGHVCLCHNPTYWPTHNKLSGSTPSMVCRWCYRSIYLWRTQIMVEWAGWLWSFFGYHPNASKTYLVVKQEHEDSAREVFADTDVRITTHGKRHLGATLDSKTFTEEYVNDKVQGWTKDIMNLAEVASSQPHAAYAAYVHGLSSCWSYWLRTVSDIDDVLQPLENIIHQHLIPALTGRPSCSSVERDLLALPARLGGLGPHDPSAISSECFQSFAAPLVALIISQAADKMVDPNTTSSINKEVKKRNHQRQDERAHIVYDQLPSSSDVRTFLRRKAPPPGCLFFYLKSTVSTCTRENSGMHSAWDMDGSQITLLRPVTVVLNSLSIMPWSATWEAFQPFITTRFAASLLTEVCNNVATEPSLQSLSGKNMTARSANNTHVDIRARGFWNKPFFDVRVFYPPTVLVHLQETWTSQEAGIWRANQRNWAWRIHPSHSLYNWRHGKGGNNLLQTSCRHDSAKTTPLPSCDGMAKMPTLVCLT